MSKLWHEGTVVEQVGPTKIRFTCPQGHVTTRDYSRGPVHQRIGAAGVKLLVRYWQDRVSHKCDKCK